MNDGNGITMVALDSAAVSYGFLQGAGWLAKQANKDIKMAKNAGIFIGAIIGFAVGAAAVALATPVPKTEDNEEPTVEEEVPYPEQEG